MDLLLIALQEMDREIKEKRREWESRVVGKIRQTAVTTLTGFGMHGRSQIEYTTKVPKTPNNKFKLIHAKMSNKMIGTLDIEIYEKAGADCLIKGWAQAKYLVHGFEDVLWTDDLDEALAFLKQSIIDEERNLTTA